jgi:hypothetical protein
LPRLLLWRMIVPRDGGFPSAVRFPSASLAPVRTFQRQRKALHGAYTFRRYGVCRRSGTAERLLEPVANESVSPASRCLSLRRIHVRRRRAPFDRRPEPGRFSRWVDAAGGSAGRSIDGSAGRNIDGSAGRNIDGSAGPGAATRAAATLVRPAADGPSYTDPLIGRLPERPPRSCPARLRRLLGPTLGESHPLALTPALPHRAPTPGRRSDSTMSVNHFVKPASASGNARSRPSSTGPNSGTRRRHRRPAPPHRPSSLRRSPAQTQDIQALEHDVAGRLAPTPCVLYVPVHPIRAWHSFSVWA